MDNARDQIQESKRNANGLSLRMVPSNPLDYAPELHNPEEVLGD